MITTNNEYCSHCQQTTYLPVRSTWARAVLNKIENDRCLKNIDRTQWYRLSNEDLLLEKYQERFYEFYEDQETTAFIKESERKSDIIPLQVIQSLLTSLLTIFITRTSGKDVPNFDRLFSQVRMVSRSQSKSKLTLCLTPVSNDRDFIDMVVCEMNICPFSASIRGMKFSHPV